MRPAHPRRPTSADVAREAGVSRSTVSYVLNDDPHQKIPAATRERVFAAAKSLAYAPSAAARTLRSGRSDLVLCLLPDWPLGASFGSLLEELAARLEAHGLTLVLHPGAHSTRSTAELWKSISPGAVILFDDVPEHEKRQMRTAASVVTISLLSDPRTDYLFAERDIGRLQVEYLAAAGHRFIGYAYPTWDRLDAFAVPRLQGAREACIELKLPQPAVLRVPLDPTAAGEAVVGWTSQENKVTAVCAYDDSVAAAVLLGARRLGIGVPNQLAVIGVDDTAMAAVAQPPLTTVARDVATIAAVITESIVRVQQGLPPLSGQPGQSPISLVRRESA